MCVLQILVSASDNHGQQIRGSMPNDLVYILHYTWKGKQNKVGSKSTELTWTCSFNVFFFFFCFWIVIFLFLLYSLKRVYLPTLQHDHCCYSERKPQENKTRTGKESIAIINGQTKENQKYQACLAENKSKDTFTGNMLHCWETKAYPT